MWIFLNDSFLSIVQKPGDRDHITVRARLRGDIEAVFPDAAVIEGAGTDYRFRARGSQEGGGRSFDEEGDVAELLKLQIIGAGCRTARYVHAGLGCHVQRAETRQGVS